MQVVAHVNVFHVLDHNWSVQPARANPACVMQNYYRDLDCAIFTFAGSNRNHHPLLLGAAPERAYKKWPGAERNMAHKVLVVDNEHIVADTLGIIFQKLGFDCQVAYSGVDAISKVPEFCPELLLCDISMPGMDGLNTASTVIQICPECRVLLLTGHYVNLIYAQQWAQDHPGQSGVLTKPVGPCQLVEEAEALLHSGNNDPSQALH